MGPARRQDRAGASGSIGAEAVARAEPDGCTLLATPRPAGDQSQPVPEAPYDPTQFVPVTVMAAIRRAARQRGRVSANTLQEFVAFVRAGDKLNCFPRHDHGFVLTTGCSRPRRGPQESRMCLRGRRGARRALAGEVK
jgi:hypothetical protein